MPEDLDIEKELEETPNEQPNQEPSKEATAGKSEEVKGEKPSSATVSILGREYDLSIADQVQELARDYERLGKLYSPLLQQVRELSQKLQEFQRPKEEPSGDVDEVTKRYLREKLGVITKEELQQIEEDRKLEEYLSALEATYDGSDGRPKFDRVKVLEFCIQNGISNPEYGYKLMNEKELLEWQLRQKKTAPAAPPSAEGKVQREMKVKKRVFGLPTNPEEEVSLREAMIETLEEAAPKTGI